MIFRWLKAPKTPIHPLEATFRLARRGVIFVLGWSIVLFGVILIVTPGPAMLVIPMGLAVLALEFAWAGRWLKRFKATLHSAWHHHPPPAEPPAPPSDREH